MPKNAVLPEILPPLLHNIPAEMRRVPHWVAYRAPVKTKADGTVKRDKVPVNPRTRGNASSSKPESWGSFQEATEAFTSDEDLMGIGYQFRHASNISAIDLDNCFDANGELYPEAAALVEEFDSFTEMSPSGKGVHIWVVGTVETLTSNKYPHSYENFEVEIFCSNFFMTVTGQPLPGKPSCGALRDAKVKLKALWRRLEQAKEGDAVKGTAPEGLRSVEEFERVVLGKLTEAGLSPSTSPEAITGGRGNPGWKWHIDCPWKGEHTGGTDRAALYFYDDRTCGFNCFHNHCAHRNYIDLVDKLGLPKPSFVDDYNSRHAVVMLEGKACVLNEERDPVTGDSRITFSTPSDFKTFYANDIKKIVVGDKEKKLRKANAWLEHPGRRQYRSIVFDPSRECETPEVYNLFSGYTVDPSKAKTCEKFLNHLHMNVCKGDDSHFHYLMAWCARLMQAPGSPLPGVSVVLQGGMGVGKGIFGRTMCRLTAPHSLHLTGQNQLVGNFNNHLKDVLLCFADEAFFAGDKQHLGKLKGIITEDKLFIEPKGVNGFMIKNNMNIIMASNEDWVVPAGIDERRFFILKLDPLGNRSRVEYFAPIYEELEDGGYEAFAKYLYEYPYDLRALRSPPVTEGLVDQKIRSLDSISNFWTYCLDTDTLMRSSNDLAVLEEDGEWGEEVLKKQIYYAYRRFCEDMRIRFPLSFQEFVRDFPAKIPGVSQTRRQVDGVRKSYFRFESLEKCQRHWKAKLEMGL